MPRRKLIINDPTDLTWQAVRQIGEELKGEFDNQFYLFCIPKEILHRRHKNGSPATLLCRCPQEGFKPRVGWLLLAEAYEKLHNNNKIILEPFMNAFDVPIDLNEYDEAESSTHMIAEIMRSHINARFAKQLAEENEILRERIDKLNANQAISSCRNF